MAPAIATMKMMEWSCSRPKFSGGCKDRKEALNKIKLPS